MSKKRKLTFTDLRRQLPGLRKKLAGEREIFLANLVMLSEIPAPTFRENKRAEFLHSRFAEAGLLNASFDEMDNVVGIYPGCGTSAKKPGILVVAHLDTSVPATIDHSVTLTPQSAIGPGVCDNGVGLAVLASLPHLLERLDWRLESNLILLGVTRSLGRGNLEGLRFFLKHNSLPCRASLCVEGVQLGRLSIMSVGMLRGEITATVPEAYDWTSFEARGAVDLITEVVRRLLAIPLPRKPRSTIVLGSIEGGGTSFNRIATNATLRFEIKSESSEIVRKTERSIKDICTELSAESHIEVVMDVLARREPGGIPFTHPLVRRAHSIMKTLNIPHSTNPSTSELSTFIESGIPAITLGITSGSGLNKMSEQADIAPMPSGLAQLLGVLAAIDRGFCDDD